MKVNRLETHDRLLHYHKVNQTMDEAVMECIKNVPEAITSPFYIYGHSRSVGLDEKLGIITAGSSSAPDTRLVWMPVITKPRPTPNTFLFLAKKGSDVIEIIWMLPKRELWDQYRPGNMFFNESIWSSIQAFINDRMSLMAPDPSGPSEKQQEEWFKIMGHEAHRRRRLKSQAAHASNLDLGK